MSQPFKKVLVLGGRGMLGLDLTAVLEELRPGGLQTVQVADIEDFDITDREAALTWIGERSPDLIINCAAYTRVDDAEINRDAAFAVNRDGAGHAAEAAAVAGAAFFQISTDYVFDGTKETPYLEDDPASPLSVYGASKWEGEEAVRRAHPAPVIIRTSWLYGANGKNFVFTMLNLGKKLSRFSVVSDQIGRPTHTMDLSCWLAGLVAARPEGGVFHAANEGCCSWFDFAGEIMKQKGLDRRVTLQPTTTKAFNASTSPPHAPRPPYSVLSLDRLAGILGERPRPWQEALKDFLESNET